MLVWMDLSMIYDYRVCENTSFLVAGRGLSRYNGINGLGFSLIPGIYRVQVCYFFVDVQYYSK